MNTHKHQLCRPNQFKKTSDELHLVIPYSGLFTQGATFADAFNLP